MGPEWNLVELLKNLVTYMRIAINSYTLLSSFKIFPDKSQQVAINTHIIIIYVLIFVRISHD